MSEYTNTKLVHGSRNFYDYLLYNNIEQGWYKYHQEEIAEVF